MEAGGEGGRVKIARVSYLKVTDSAQERWEKSGDECQEVSVNEGQH